MGDRDNVLSFRLKAKPATWPLPTKTLVVDVDFVRQQRENYEYLHTLLGHWLATSADAKRLASP